MEYIICNVDYTTRIYIYIPYSVYHMLIYCIIYFISYGTYSTSYTMFHAYHIISYHIISYHGISYHMILLYCIILVAPPLDPCFLASTNYSGRIPSASHEKSSLWVQGYITSFSDTRERAPLMSMPHLAFLDIWGSSFKSF